MKGRSVHELLRDYHDVLARSKELSKEQAKRLRDYEKFVRTRQHVLAVEPRQFFAQAWAQPRDSAVRADVEKLAGPACPWFRLRHPPETDPNPALLLTVDVGVVVHAVAVWEHGGRRVAVAGCRDGLIRRYDLATGREITPPLQGHTSSVNAAAVSGDGRHALSGSWDDTLRWWDLEGGACLRSLEGHTTWVYAVAVSGDGRHALSGSDDQTLRWWNLDSGRCLAVFRHDSPIRAVALSPCSPYLIAASDTQGQVLFFDLRQPDET
jgi:WD40 repeat protein